MAAKKKSDTPVFEIVIVLAIVFMVTVTGLVLTSYERKSALTGSDFGMTGLVVSEPTAQGSAAETFIDVGVSKIAISPPSPVIGQPFDVTVTVSNEGSADISTPFYVEVKLRSGDNSDDYLTKQAVMTKSLKAGETADISLKLAVVGAEGPYRIIASADSTAKLDDKNPANNEMSKTVIITNI